MFFIGGLPALLGLFVRFKVKESAVWRKAQQSSWGNLGREIVSHWKLFLYLTLLMMMMNLASHGTQDMFPTFLQRQWSLGPSKRAVITAISMVGAILGGLLFGSISDWIGRRKAMIASLVGAVALVPLWAYAPSLPLLIAGAFLIQFMVQGAWGVIPAHLSELSPNSVRGFLPGFAYQCGVLLAGSVAYVEAILAQHTSYANAMALTAFVIFTLATIVVALGREKSGIDFAS
jgi:SHS family lactate transporter-like MFS transporter